MRARTLIALFIAAALTSPGATSKPLAAGSNVNLLPQTTTPMLPGTTQPINATFGNQTNPHVACNLVSYTNDDFEGTSAIKYFDFATNTEHLVPGNGLDRLSETDGRRIVFTQIDAEGDHIVLYDLASQTTTQIPGSHNFDPVIGGNLVAFVHGLPFAPDSADIEVYDQNTGNVTQLTNDGLRNYWPAVSPDGNVVVWEKCQTDGAGCDIYSATQTGPGAFTTRQLTTTGKAHFPDTNGQIVVYVSDKSGEDDIYFQRLGSATEMHLSIPGDQRDVSISGNLIAFESGGVFPQNYDIFLYDLSTARLFQVTNTPGVDETLTDLVSGCNGLNRIVYAIPGGGDFDVYGFTFQLNDSTTAQLNLITLVQSFNLHDGTEASLITKLQSALAAVNASDTATACDSLTAFINAGQAQSGKKLTADQVNQLVGAATQIKSDLGCN